jgi:LuxR family transcriptional regulator, maltose regulon positive regulatory protein
MVDTSSLVSIIKTKLYRPPVTEDFVPRPQLVQRLDQNHARPLTVLSAPAGYGKTTLLSAWLEDCSCHSVWLSLDETDNDLAAFLTYFVASLRLQFPQVGEKILALLDAAILSPFATIASYLFFELDQIEPEFIVVLDDYHVITDQNIHALLTVLLRHPLRAMHLVISTRHDPPLPLSTYRARKLLTEIRTQDLRFSTEEISVFAQRAVGLPLDQGVIAILEEKTEGWPAGLRLASLSFRHSQDLVNSLANLQGDNRYIMEYLVSEVLSHLEPATQDFLLKTSILDRLCEPLCQVVAGLDGLQTDGQAILDGMQKTNLFIVPLDEGGYWYRYHHLFQGILRNRLARRYTPDQIAALHSRASGWFAQNGLVREAIDHALASGDIKAAVGLVAQHRHGLMSIEQWQRLARWLHLFSQSTIDEYPDLLLIEAWLSHVQRFDLQKVTRILDRAEDLLSQNPMDTGAASSLLGEIDTLRSYTHYHAADGQKAIQYALASLERTPDEAYLVRSYAWLHLALAYQMTGDLEAAFAAVAAGLKEDFSKQGPAYTRVAMSSCFIYWISADLPNMLNSAGRTLAVGQANQLQESTGWGHYLLASGYYYRNELTAAQDHANTVINHRSVDHGIPFTYSAVILALTYQAQGLPDNANQVIESTYAFLEDMGAASLLQVLRAFRAELALLQGRIAEAGQWAAQVGSSLPLMAMPLFYAPQLTLPKVLLALNTSISRQQAAEILARLYEFVNATHNTRFLIEVLAMQALLLDARNDEQAAFKAVEQAITLAQTGGFIRLFADLGPRMQELLNRLHSRGIASIYLNQILAAFHDAKPAVPTVGPAEIIEPLTGRELEVITLLVQRLSNKEIAQELFISPITVKRHTINIYQKLNVNNRRDAIALAVALGIVLPKKTN